MSTESVVGNVLSKKNTRNVVYHNKTEFCPGNTNFRKTFAILLLFYSCWLRFHEVGGGWLKLGEAGRGKKRMKKVPMLGEVGLGRVRLGEEE